MYRGPLVNTFNNPFYYIANTEEDAEDEDRIHGGKRVSAHTNVSNNGRKYSIKLFRRGWYWELYYARKMALGGRVGKVVVSESTILLERL